jgi:long-chain acyl-CoA synthetase
LTYAELDARANRLAAWLVSQDVGVGDRVLWLGQNCHRVLEGVLACAKVGAVFCPVNWRGTTAEYGFVLEDLEPKVVIWQEAEIGDKVRAARESYAGDPVWLAHDTDGPDSYEQVLRDSSDEDTYGDSDPEAAVLILYTAAWQGKPNGATIPQRAITGYSIVWAWLFDKPPTHTYLSCAPLFHVVAMAPMLATFHIGGKNVFVPRVEPRSLVEVIEREHVNDAFIIEPTISQILELDDVDQYDLHSLKVWPTFDPKWIALTSLDTSRWGQGPAGYGQTECMGFLTAAGLGGVGVHGRALPGLQIRLLTPDGGDVAAGDVGEIAARGVTVMLGYHNRPELNEERFQDGWYRTGDLGRRESDGSLTWVGPKGRLVKSGAENIYVAEVEACIGQHPDVKEVGIIGVPDETWGQSVKAIVVADLSSGLTEAAIIEHCRSRLASYKKPSSVVIRQEPLPRADAAIDYDALDRQYDGGGYPGTALFRQNAKF